MNTVIPQIILASALLAACRADRPLGEYGATVRYEANDGAQRAAAQLPPCRFAPSPVPATWSTARLGMLPATLRVSPTLRVVETASHEDGEMWSMAGQGMLVFLLTDGSGAYHLSFDDERRPLEETNCQALLGSHLAGYQLVTVLGANDTTFVVKARALLNNGHAFDVAVLAKTRTVRDEMLQSIQSITFGDSQ